MIVVPFYIELASDEQLEQVKYWVDYCHARFFTGEKMEGITLEEVQERVNAKDRG